MSSIYKRALRCTSGVAAIELGLTLPVLLTLLLGGIELSRYMLVQQKVEKLAFSVADVLTQYDTLNAATVENILSATNNIVNPYSFEERGVVVVSSVHKDEADDNQKVRWQCDGGGEAVKDSLVGITNGPAVLPGELILDDKDNIIVAEVYYTFEPIFPGLFLDSIEVYKTAMFRPRLGALTSAPGC